MNYPRMTLFKLPIQYATPPIEVTTTMDTTRAPTGEPVWSLPMQCQGSILAAKFNPRPKPVAPV